MLFTTTKKRYGVDIWPGFVDAMATVLMVVVFVLMTFVVAQIYLTDAISGKNKDLTVLEKNLSKLREELADSQKHTAALVDESTALKKRRDVLDGELDDLRQRMAQLERISSDLQTSNTQLIQIRENLEAEKEALLEKNNQQEAALHTAKKGIGFYRSEFFAKLQKLLGNRSDIRVVGDRFIFQSEVLFSQGSADLDKNGSKELDRLISALKEIIGHIPDDLHWVLRVDGHTDQLPIRTPQFPSNWELSAARAISVVKYLEGKGIQAHHLVAAGFGEHHPLTQTSEDLARNRRIEFKLDQR